MKVVQITSIHGDTSEYGQSQGPCGCAHHDAPAVNHELCNSVHITANENNVTWLNELGKEIIFRGILSRG
jgi:hypothetical protein